jgi:D-alanyl-lipoteichoic acid acyltransferase DltB (MBOAT superfamily)
VIDLPGPGPLFNPLISSQPLSPTELLAGPFGLIAFLPLIPPLLLAGRRFSRAALGLAGLVWLLATLGPTCTTVLLAGIAAGMAWILVLGKLSRHGKLGRAPMIALVWIGLHALVVPLWWQAQQPWYPSRMAALHNVGIAYFLLRFIAWGVELARDPHRSLRLTDTICWLLYPPCMRLGPVLLREQFLHRLDQWDPRRSPAGKAGLTRIGLFLLGGAGLALVGRHLPTVTAGAADFFAAPENYPTEKLLRVFYLVPIWIYLVLWTYNQLAVALSLLVGIRVDDNFRRLPLATSVRDFWHRWHITVGGWLRDYIYVPLGGSRRRVLLSTAAVFVYCGLWHGASWSFLVWGLSQAVALMVQRAWSRWRRRLGARAPHGPLWTAFCWLLTMHYQLATIVVVADFEHLGLRLFRELLVRGTGLAW